MAASSLPVDSTLPALLTALRDTGHAVLQAPPGAGKTTRVPLYLLDHNLTSGKILMLEPRRVAARAAADRLAQQINEKPGKTVGYRMRGESKPGTRIEVVTEGILTRMIQSDPDLPGIGCIIFDEFHERSLNADLGLALALEIREALRPDLKLLVMSATLDAAPVAALMGDAPVITSDGQSFPVDTIHLDQPWRRPNQRSRFEVAMAALIEKAFSETTGSLLAFFPGQGEIRRTQALLSLDAEILPLYGALPFKDQRRALTATGNRRVILATSIAETSLTLPDITCVVDGGQSRRARFDPGSGMSRLITERVTRAEATQRTGRAGRVQAGTCYRLWTKGEEGALAAFPPAEIESTDLTALVLELAQWGVDSADGMKFLTPPPEKAFTEAQTLLRNLDALDDDNRITDHGRTLAALPIHPRLGHMLATGGKAAAPLAALLENRDPLRGRSTDLGLRLEALTHPPKDIDQAALAQIREEVKRLTTLAPIVAEAYSPAQLLSLAYPDRIGLRRNGDDPRYLLSGGKGAVIAPDDPLASSRMVVAADLDGDTKEAKLRLGLATSEADMRALHKTQAVKICDWDPRTRAVVARERVMLGALILEDRHWKDAPDDAVTTAMLTGIRSLGIEALNWTKAARLLQFRVEWLRARGADMPDCSASGLVDSLEDWLAPYLSGIRKAADLSRVDIHAALKSHLTWEQTETLTREAPEAITAPTGTKLPIDYSGAQPSVKVRLQEMFGLTIHPTVGPDCQPLLIELLSPAQRPVQTTADLPGFWVNSYADVRKDMRGRYPKHPWPEDPIQADPTRRVKPRPAS